MNLDESTYYLIEKYLEGLLPSDHPFIKMVQDHPELAEEVAMHRLTQDAIIDQRLTFVADVLHSKRKDFVLQNQRGSWAKWTGLGALILISSILYLSFFPEKESNQALIPYKMKGDTSTQNMNSQKHENRISTTKSIVTPKPTSPEHINTPIVEDISMIDELNPMTLKDENLQNISDMDSLKAPSYVLNVTNHCEGIILKAQIEPKRPCHGEANGEITISGIQGGIAPYQYSIDGKTYHDQNNFGNLKAGDYSIALKDRRGCSTLISSSFKLDHIICTQMTDLIFNPNVKALEIPLQSDKQGVFEIFDENGYLLFNRNFMPNDKLFWNGTSNSGALLKPNVYIYSIKYSDIQYDHGRITINY